MPLIYRDWASFDAPKTGSLSRREAFLRAGGRKHKGQHDRPSQHADLLATHRCFGTVRNPFSWYPSLWRFALHRGQVGPVATYASAWIGGDRPTEEQLTFRGFLRGVTRPTPGRVPLTVGCVYACGKPEKLIRSGLGLCSYTFGWMYDRPIELRRLDDLEADLRAMGLECFHVHRTEPPMDYADLYDAEMVRWVQEADGELLERFRWTSPRRTT